MAAGYQPADAIKLKTLARALPSGLAFVGSRAKWRPAPHLDLLTKKLVALEQRRITRLFVEMPPRHGKSNLCSHFFPAWYLGRHPDHNVMLASYQGTFAQLWGERARDVLVEYGPEVFGIRPHSQRKAASDWRIAGHLGRMRCTGVTGGITGRGADLLIIDDPIKDAVEASSEIYRERTWDWYTSTARTRMEPGGIIIVIQTRWHQEDLIGRLRRQATLGGEQWDSVTLPALAEDGDLLGRAPGEALWPERFTAEQLLAIKNGMPSHWWNALFQQRPTPPGGALAKTVWFPVVHALPPNLRRCRFWDIGGDAKKGTGDPDWTVGALVARSPDGRFFIEDIIRVQYTSADVEKLIVQTAHTDGHDVPIREEQEGGSSGLAIINQRKRALAGFNYSGQRPLGKPGGWTPMLIQAEVGNVFMFHDRGCKCGSMGRGEPGWNAKFLAEVADAPHGSHDDQLDGVAGAMHYLSQVDPTPASDIFSIGGETDELKQAINSMFF